MRKVPIERNSFGDFSQSEAASRASLQAMGAAAMQVAKPNCPVDTGYLKNSHRYVVNGDHVDIGVTADYGNEVHNGTARQKAQPWLKNAVDANMNSITDFGKKRWAQVMGL